MSDEYSGRFKEETLYVKIIHFLEDIWPWVYRILNDLFYGILGFIKDIFTGFLPK